MWVTPINKKKRLQLRIHDCLCLPCVYSTWTHKCAWHLVTTSLYTGYPPPCDRNIRTGWHGHEEGRRILPHSLPPIPPPFLLNFMCIFSRARICKPFSLGQESIPSMAGLYDNLICWTGPPGYIYRLAEKSIPELLKGLQIRAQDDGGGGVGLKVTVSAPETGNRKFSPETCFKTAERISRICDILYLN